MAKERFNPRKKGVYIITMYDPERHIIQGPAEFDGESWKINGKVYAEEEIASWQTVDGSPI